VAPDAARIARPGTDAGGPDDQPARRRERRRHPVGPAARGPIDRSPRGGNGLWALACAGVAAIVGGGTGPLATAGIVGAGFGVGGISPLVRAIPAELDGIGATLTGAAVGLVFAVGEVGGFLGPVLVGTLRDATGSFAAGFGVLAAGGLVVVLAGAALDVRG